MFRKHATRLINPFVHARNCIQYLFSNILNENYSHFFSSPLQNTSMLRRPYCHCSNCFTLFNYTMQYGTYARQKKLARSQLYVVVTHCIHTLDLHTWQRSGAAKFLAPIQNALSSTENISRFRQLIVQTSDARQVDATLCQHNKQTIAIAHYTAIHTPE